MRFAPGRDRVARLAVAAALAFLLADLLASSTLLRKLRPFDAAWLAWSPASSWATLAFLLLLVLSVVPALGRARPLPAWLGIAAGTCGVALYGWSNLDWTLLAADAGIAAGGAPDPATVVVAVLPFVLVLGHAAYEDRHRLSAHLAEKGIDPEETRAAAAAFVPASRRDLAAALGLWVLLVLGFAALGAAAPLARPLAAAAPLAVPVAVGALVAAAVWALRRG